MVVPVTGSIGPDPGPGSPGRAPVEGRVSIPRHRRKEAREIPRPKPVRTSKIIAAIAILALTDRAHGQCPQLYDYYGTPSSAPYWYSCSGNNFTLLIATPNSVGNYTIDWGDGSPTSSGAMLVPPMSVSHVYPATVDTFVVTFTETITGCVVQGVVVMEESTSASIQIPVGGLTQICAPQAIEFINSSTNVSPNTVFTWDFGDGSTPEVYDYTNLGQTITHTYQQGTVSCETTVMLTAENTCNTLQGGPSVATFNPIRVWDLDSARITPSATLLCYPDTEVTFLNTTQRNCLMQGNIYQRFEYWNFGDYWGAGTDSIIDWTPWPPTFPHTIAYPGIGTYTATLLDSNYCGIDTAIVTIQIVPPPDVYLTLTPDTICAGETAYFDETTTGGANYFEWDLGTGSGWQWTGAGDQAHTYTNPGTYVIGYTASIQGATAGCADTAYVTLVVLPSPTAQFTLDNDAACDSLTVTVTDTSTGAIAWAWDFGDGTFSASPAPPPHTYSTVGDFTITLTVTNGNNCTAAMAQDVHVYDPPQVAIGAQNVCVGDPTQFTDLTATASGNPVVQWLWDFGDGATDTIQDPTHLYPVAGPYLVTLTATTPYCSGTGTQPIVVEPKPTAAFVPGSLLGCSPFTVPFTNTSSGAADYAWDFGDGAGSTSATPVHTYMNLGTTDTVYTVTLIASTAFGCSDTTTANITVAPMVVAQFTHDASPSCSPIAVNFYNGSTGAGSYSWDFGDGTTSTLQDPSHTFSNTTLYLVTYTVTLVATSAAGCADTTTQQISVFPEANFSFVVAPDSGCSPFTLTFPSVLGAVSFDWDFGDGGTGTGPTPTHTYVNTGTSDVVHPVTLIAANAFGCVDTMSAQVVVHPSPIAQFVAAPATGCTPLNVGFQDLSIGASTLWWDFGDGTTLSTGPGNVAHTYMNYAPTDAFENVVLVATSSDGCTDTAFTTVQIHPAVQASFSTDTAGCAPFTVTLNDASTGAVSYLWHMGDGTVLTGPGPTYTYLNTGTTNLSYTIMEVATSAYGCSDTAYFDVTVYPVPVASFTATPFSQQFPDATVTVTNTTPPGSYSYAWSFGDGGTSTAQDPGDHTYSTWGTFTITLVVSTALCSDTATQIITIDPPVPTVGFTGGGDGCVPLTVSFTNTSLGGVSYQWNFGDGGTSTADDPTYTYNVPGTYTVTLTAFGLGGAVNTISQADIVVAHPRANAFFVLQPDEVLVPDQPVFTYNLSANASSYWWDFGDGSTSTEENPVHYYTAPGSYDVMLIANNEWNCPDTFLLAEATTGTVAGDLLFPNAFTPGNNGPTDGVYDPTSFENDFFFPIHEGVEDYRLQVFNRWGELVFESVDVRKGWDGYYRDSPAKQDVYAWKAWARFSDGRETTLSGDVTLLR